MEYINNILVVDDEPYILSSISALLENQFDGETEVFSTNTSQDALKLMQKHRIDILLTDVKMPGMSGIELAQMVRKYYPACVVIVLTAYAEFDFIQQAMNAGVTQYVLKTSSKQEITDAVRNAMRIWKQNLSVLAWDTSRNISEGLTLSQEPFMLAITRIWKESSDKRIYMACSKIPLVECGVEQYLMLLNSFAICFLSHNIRLCSYEIIDNKVFWLLLPEDERASSSRISDILEEISAAVKILLHVHVSFMLSHGITTTEEVKLFIEGMESAVSKLENRMGCIQIVGPENILAIKDDELLEKIDAYIESHISKKLTLCAIAADIGYNASYLSRLFSGKYQINISDYIREKKIRYINSLLRNPKLSLDAVSELSGFETRISFHHFIKYVTGETPQTYRRILCPDKA